MIKKLFFAGLIFVTIAACNDDNNDWNPPVQPETSEAKGFYVLNEGSWGGDNSTLSYFDYETGIFTNDFFGHNNPNQAGLGDVGNDLKIYGSKMYAVINASNYVEVMDAKTAKHIAKVQIPNARRVAFDKGFAYVTSFAGTVGDAGQLGYVAKIDTLSLSITGKESVGYQPEGLAAANGKLYVANSGGYNFGVYDNKVSVIDLNSFKVVKTLTLNGVTNLSQIKLDKNKHLWISSDGNYSDIAPAVCVLDVANDSVLRTLNITASDFDFYENNLYYCGSAWTSAGSKISYGIVNINSLEKTSDNFIGAAKDEITVPYGLTINQFNGDIVISDALDYVSNGKIFCFDKNGSKKWVQMAGIVPGRIAFLEK